MKLKLNPCLVQVLWRLIENGKIEGEEIDSYLQDKVEPFKSKGIAAIVLGCTHYPFVKKALSTIVSMEVPIIDGSKGTVKQLTETIR